MGYFLKITLALFIAFLPARPLKAAENSECFQIASFANLNVNIRNFVEPLIQSIYHKNNQCADFLPVHPRRSAQLLREGLIDGELVRAELALKGQEDLITIIPQPMFIVEFKFLWTSKIAFNGSVNDLGNKTIGILSGQLTTEKNLSPHSQKITSLNGLDRAAELLRRNRIQILAADNVSLSRIEQEVAAQGLKIKTKTFYRAPAYHILAKKHKAHALPLARALQGMLERGELDFIRQYSLEPAAIVKLP